MPTAMISPTAKEAAFIGAKIQAIERGKLCTDIDAARQAGYAFPKNHSSDVAARPHVQKLIRDYLDKASIRRKCKSVLEDGLNLSSEDNPVGAQAERRRTVETVGRFLGEIDSPDSPSQSPVRVVVFIGDGSLPRSTDNPDILANPQTNILDAPSSQPVDAQLVES